MKDSNRRKSASASTHLNTLTIALCLALAFLAVTPFNVHASPLAHNNARSMNALARGGGGGHAGGSGGHAGTSEAGGHSLGSDTTTLHNNTEEENNTNNTHNSNNNYNGHRNFIPVDRSPGQNNISITQVLWSLLIVAVVLAFIFYLNRRRAQSRL